MAAYYKVPISELTDDPGAPIEGIDVEKTKKMTPAKRLIMQSVAQKISPDNVTDEYAEKVWRAIESLIDEGIIRPKG